MTQLWPRISPGLARALFLDLARDSVERLVAQARCEHARATYAATGGTRVPPAVVGELTHGLRETAAEFGYPRPAGDAERIQFDRAAAEVLYSRMDVTSVEGGNREVWNFIALIAAPDLTQWRFGAINRERWVATDLTRHMFSRLWWQALTFAEPTTDGRLDYRLLRGLNESDLNQIMERRSLAGNPRLVRAIARAVIEDGSSRRTLLRDLTPRLRRRLPFIDFAALNDEQLADHIRSLRLA